jgi:hypothetical protein
LIDFSDDYFWCNQVATFHGIFPKTQANIPFCGFFSLIEWLTAYNIVKNISVRCKAFFIQGIPQNLRESQSELSGGGLRGIMSAQIIQPESAEDQLNGAGKFVMTESDDVINRRIVGQLFRAVFDQFDGQSLTLTIDEI